MSFTLRSTSTPFNENERLTRKRQATASSNTSTTLNRFLSFNENTSSSAENRRQSLQSTPNLIELLEEEDDDTEDYQALCHECSICEKVFASEYGLNHHISMHHPNQSILCSLCNITFRSHRSLKTHHQRRHPSTQTKVNSTHPLLPNYSHISSYLVLPFSSKQFAITAKNACEQERLPLGSLTSKLYQCHLCHVSFPCSRTLKYHFINQHEQYEYKLCETILTDILVQVEFNLRTVNDDEIDSFKLTLAQQASHFGLIDKQLSNKFRSMKTEQNHLVYPFCQHENRTCANLCLQYLSSYSKLIKNYPYTITTVPKGNPFAQGSIVSIVSSIHNVYSNGSASTNELNGSTDLSNGRQKRKSVKHTDSSPSSTLQSKKKAISNVVITDLKTNRTSSNNKAMVTKQQIDSPTKINDAKLASAESPSSFTLALTPSSTVPRKILPKDNHMRSSSISSNSSTSTRSSTIKSSSSSTNLTQQTSMSSQRFSKRSLSPSMSISLDTSLRKRRRPREQKKSKMIPPSPTVVIRIDDDDDENDVEQENGDDDEDDIDADVVPIKFEQPKSHRQSRQRKASSGSIEYVQTLNNDQQSTASLNNIENIKSKSKINDEEIIICRSPPMVRKVEPSANKNHSKASVNRKNGRKSNGQQSPNNDEHVRVRCKICGEILEGRSRFSTHVITMHSHLIKKDITSSKQQQQQQQQTTIVR